MSIKKLLATIVLATGTCFSYSQTCTPGINYWIPEKTSLRSGLYNNSYLEMDSIGCFTAAFGVNVLAMGTSSFATGFLSRARANYSTAQGYYNTAWGEMSLAMGRSSQAIGFASVAIGNNLFSKSYGGMVVGMHNDTADAPNSATPAMPDRIFQIGNGQWSSSRSNAVTVLRNGQVGIGEISPQKNMSIKGGLNVDQGNGHIAGTVGDNMITFGSYSGEGIGSDRSTSGTKWALNFYTNNLPRMVITNAGDVTIGSSLVSQGAKLGVQGDVLATGNIKVQTNKGIVRSSDATQQKIVYTDVNINIPNMAANATTMVSFNWSEAFSTSPSAYVGNITNGTSGWVENTMAIFATPTLGQLWIRNIAGVTQTKNFTIRIIAIGAQ